MRTIMIALLVLLTGVTAQAQDVRFDADLSQFYVFADGTTFRYPATWEGESYEALASVFNEDYYFTLMNYDFFERRGLPAEADLTTVMQTDFDSVYGAGMFDPSRIVMLTVNGREALRYDFTDESETEARSYAIRLSDGTFGLMYAFSNSDLPLAQAPVRAILRTFDSNPLEKLLPVLVEVAALEGVESVADDLIIRYPVGWTIEQLDFGVTFYGPGEATSLIAFDPAENAAFGITSDATPVEALQNVYGFVNEGLEEMPTFNEDYLTALPLNGRLGLRYDYLINEESWVSLFVIELGTGDIGIAIASTVNNALPSNSEIFAMIASFGESNQAL
jgi:hypothetical protein